MSKSITGTQFLNLGENISIDRSSVIRGERVVIEDNVRIGKNVRIIAKEIFIGKNCLINDDTHAEVATLFSLGKNSILGRSNSFHCRKFTAGDFFYMGKNNEVGGGGSFNHDSELEIGKYCMVVDRVMLNTSDKIVIGDDVGIGSEVMIWTHGSYNAVLDGFPADFAPVTIRSHVWIPARIIILPGISIGDHVVVGINSLVNKNLPSGCFAAGMPAKILRQNAYPKKTSNKEKDEIAETLLREYRLVMTYKGIHSVITYNKGVIDLKSHDGENSFFNIYNMTWGGSENIYFEDLRDFLRRKGIKFFTDNMFSSILPPAFRDLENLKP